MSRAAKKNLKFKLFYFENKARYRDENRQAGIFPICLLRDEDKNSNNCLLCNLMFLRRRVPTKNYNALNNNTGYLL